MPGDDSPVDPIATFLDQPGELPDGWAAGGVNLDDPPADATESEKKG